MAPPKTRTPQFLKPVYMSCCIAKGTLLMKSRLQNLKQIILDYLDGTKLMTGDTKSRELEEILQKVGTQYKKKKNPINNGPKM